MKKNGFTLVELLAVIAILGVIMVIAIPNVMDMFNSGVDKTMTIQENNMLDAANLFTQDNCGRNAISRDRKAICTAAISGNKAYFVTDVITKFDYMDPIKHKGATDCKGYVEFTYNSSTGKFTDGKTYVYCGDGTLSGTVYFTGKDENNSADILNRIKSTYSTYLAKEITG